MATWTETPPGSGLYAFDDGNPPLPDVEIVPRVGTETMVLHREADPDPATVRAAITPDYPHIRIRPGRAIRIGVTHITLGTRWLFRGFIDEIRPVDKPDDWSTVKFACIDALGEAGRAKLVTDTETGANEQANTRAERILNTITWPTAKRTISASATSPLYAAALDGQVVDLLRQTADSEGGWCFADTDGNIVFQHRDWLYLTSESDIAATIGNIGAFDVCPSGWERSFARKDITTRVILNRNMPDGMDPAEPVVYDDLPAQTLYGIEPLERSDLWTRDDIDIFTIAGRLLANRSAEASMPRIRSVTLDAATSDAAIDVLTALSIFTPSRYRCRLYTERGTVFDDEFFAVGVTHTLSSEEWTAEISLDRSDPYGALPPADTFIWDTARWDHALWN